jgi:hypothetical protein
VNRFGILFRLNQTKQETGPAGFFKEKTNLRSEYDNQRERTDEEDLLEYPNEGYEVQELADVVDDSYDENALNDDFGFSAAEEVEDIVEEYSNDEHIKDLLPV